MFLPLRPFPPVSNYSPSLSEMNLQFHSIWWAAPVFSVFFCYPLRMQDDDRWEPNGGDAPPASPAALAAKHFHLFPQARTDLKGGRRRRKQWEALRLRHRSVTDPQRMQITRSCRSHIACPRSRHKKCGKAAGNQETITATSALLMNLLMIAVGHLSWMKWLLPEPVRLWWCTHQASEHQGTRAGVCSTAIQFLWRICINIAPFILPEPGRNGLNLLTTYANAEAKFKKHAPS